MAALLKKRALAEYSQSQTILAEPVEPPQPKRLRIIKKPADTSNGVSAALKSDINDLEATRSATENFKALSRIVASLPTTAENEALLHKKLITLFHNDKDTALRAKCLTTLQLLQMSQTDSLGILDEIIRMVAKETSPLVIVSSLTVSLKLAKIAKNSMYDARLVSMAKKFITSTDTTVKCKCLELIGSLVSYEDPTVITETLQLIHKYSHSHEPRVRSAALKMMIQLSQKGAPMDVSIYSEVAKYLDDDYESVKLAAVQLLWTISQSYPEKMIPAPIGGGEKMRLIDDAFAKTCHAINDPCVQVRVLAATLLGKMPQVGQTFLDQTLDKKLMSDMRRKRSAHERQWEKVKAGEWSSGKKWADDAPKEYIDAESVSLISSGSAGAFVHGLEDEFMEVRSAAVDSLCTLALKSPDFSNLALDFLVDMFNDEIEEVRVKAIDSLTKISKHIVLWEDQLEVILSALEDSSIDIREGLHKLLSVCHLMTKDCVNMCLEHLLDNLKKYPQDKKSIWKCLEGVGKNHPWVVLPLVPQLLSMHPFFDTAETDPEDPAYVSVLILVLNAAKGCPTMATLFDVKLMRHYHYLRDTLPHLVPDLILGNDTCVISSSGTSNSISSANVSGTSDKASSSGGTNAKGRLVLKELIGKLKNSENLTPEMRLRLSKLILKDLKRLAEVDQEVSAVAKFTALFIRAQLVYTNCIGCPSWVQLTQNTPNDTLKQQIQSFLQLCLKMQYGFSGLSPQEFAIIIQLKLRALAFQLVYIVRGSNASALATCQNLLEQAETVQKYLEENGNLAPDDFTLAMFKMLDSLDDPKPGTVAKLLLPLFEAHPIPLVSFSSSTTLQIKQTGERPKGQVLLRVKSAMFAVHFTTTEKICRQNHCHFQTKASSDLQFRERLPTLYKQVKMASATIVEPTGDSDTPMKFTAGLLLGIPFDCELYDFSDMSHVRIRVKYPDQQVHLIYPRVNDFRTVTPDETRLLTTINASHQAWTEPCPITLSVVLDLSGPETNYNRKLVGKNDPTYIIQLSEEKQVLVCPKPPKRGI